MDVLSPGYESRCEATVDVSARMRPMGRHARAFRNPVFVPYGEAFGRVMPRVAVFVGAGASHSWIWFADLLERLGIYDVEFITEHSVLSAGLDRMDFLLIGGGDTYAMAEALGEPGARAIEDFVRRGGLYFGSCAGAYLVLTGVDLEPFTPFNLVDGNMINVMPDPPPPRCLEHKYLAPYGEEWVFHPVYGEVEIASTRASLVFPCFEDNHLRTTLFGGPVLEAARVEDVIAVYSGLSDRAAYMWERNEAARLLTGRPAVIRAELGRGIAIVSGPHLEHPLYPHSNALIAEMMSIYWSRDPGLRDPAQGVDFHSPSRGEGQGGGGAKANGQHDASPLHPGLRDPAKQREVRELLYEIKRQVSNARIVGFGLEKLPVIWKIGVKVWEPAKIRMFLDCAWSRLDTLDANAGTLDPEDLAPLAHGYSEVTLMARNLKMEVESGKDSRATAESLITSLKELTARYLSLYYRTRLSGNYRA